MPSTWNWECVIATAERAEYKVGEVVQHTVIWFVESGKVGSVKVAYHAAAEDSNGTQA